MILNKKTNGKLLSTQKRNQGGDAAFLAATRRRMTGQVIVLPEEDLAAYDTFSNAIVAAFSPEGACEVQLAQSYATYQWRINRSASIEENLYSLGIMEQVAENLNIEHDQARNAASYAKTFRSECHQFERLILYSQGLISQSGRVLRQLKTMQRQRWESEEKKMMEAMSVYEACCQTNAAFDPKEHGFDFTVAEIAAAHRRQSLRQTGTGTEQARSGGVKAA
jgi:hypothetical protein